ncbi:hypothetical protein Phum_PHUM071400 [Pediculus humanus corporis]|uniref:Uncharacterized protein n=1 Tax=Pediculus humanus subsp. corporis TaxID=121224 RepID=E0VBU3_PEDHC|nr:uncharacterized protein Phum_PHUM071400 [Pediculus humanus corporis]EEB10849.1 hypothetical protein Phum_PHUM071400 [Pediculus humanus corporis]
MPTAERFTTSLNTTLFPKNKTLKTQQQKRESTNAFPNRNIQRSRSYSPDAIKMYSRPCRENVLNNMISASSEDDDNWEYKNNNIINSKREQQIHQLQQQQQQQQQERLKRCCTPQANKRRGWYAG